MRILALIGALAVILAIVAGGYFLGGFYNVAASADEPVAVSWVLARTRGASVARQAKAAGQPPFPLDDAKAVQDGARAFQKLGCANCHGAPGAEWAKFSEGLNPGPPDLKEEAKDMPAGAIFWVVKNGIRMTGMPSFAKAGASDTEIWQIAAFVKKLPTVAEADYKTWTAAR